MYHGQNTRAILKHKIIHTPADLIRTSRKIPVEKSVVILGTPNTGKTALFNQLTGRHQKTANFPGVTVERKRGILKALQIGIEDLPGTYSLKSQSLDEEIVSNYVQGWRNRSQRPDAVIIVVNATNMPRTLFLALQILEWDIPAVIALNMIDEARKQRLRIDTAELSRRLGMVRIVETSAKSGEGIDQLISAIGEICAPAPGLQNGPVWLRVDDRMTPLQDLLNLLDSNNEKLNFSPLMDSMRLVADDAYWEHIAGLLDAEQRAEVQNLILRIRETFHVRGIQFRTLEADARYRFIDEELMPLFHPPSDHKTSVSEKIDNLITHPVYGTALFFFVMAFIFTAVFSWAKYPMELIEKSLDTLALQTGNILPAGDLASLVRDGIIGGVGNIIVFLPQIILLVFFLGLLEDSGYMARISFLMDGMMRRLGLHGKAILPLLSGFACAIPAVMAARTIENWRDRLIVIMLIPLMSCSARLPVYTLLISAFVPPLAVFGFIPLQGLVLLVVYFLGFATAVGIAVLIKKIRRSKTSPHFIMELPPYRLPLLRSVWWRIYDASKTFLLNAGSIILAMTIVLWFLASHPRPDNSETPANRNVIEQSYAGRIGHLIEPVIKPLGFDWKIGVGLITSFAAREVIIATFATLYNIDSEDENIVSLGNAMRADRYADGEPVFTPLVAVSLLVFYVFAAQCMSTFAIIRRETNSWLWPVVLVLYMNTLAYFAALLVYQSGIWLGIG